MLRERLRPVTSRQNSIVRQLRRSFSQGELVEGHCAIEGTRMIEEAIRSGLPIHAICFSESGKTRAERLLNQISKKAETLVLPDEIFQSMVETEHSQGVAALVKAPQFKAEELVALPSPLLVVSAGIQDPGNLCTIIRSAEAFQASGLVLTEKSVSQWNAKVVRSSAGSVFRLPIVPMQSGELLQFLQQHGVRSAAAVARNGSKIQEYDFTVPTAILIGNEGAGVPRELLNKAGSRICIPQAETLESLNAGIAASIILYEGMRQRGQARSSSQSS